MFSVLLTFGQNPNTELYQKVFDKNDGFEIDFVSTMVFDDSGFLWIGGSNLDNRVIISRENSNILQRFNGFSFDASSTVS